MGLIRHFLSLISFYFYNRSFKLRKHKSLFDKLSEQKLQKSKGSTLWSRATETDQKSKSLALSNRKNFFPMKTPRV